MDPAGCPKLPEHVYLTIDTDGFDPSVLHGTGTPEPGGLSNRQLVPDSGSGTLTKRGGCRYQ
jgi:arginase family enzyme